MDKDALQSELNELLDKYSVLMVEVCDLRSRMAKLRKQINRKDTITLAQIKETAFARRKEIAEKIQSGMSAVEVAAEYKISVTRVNQLRSSYLKRQKYLNNK